MGSGYDIGARVSLSGEKEYRAAVGSIKKETSALVAELNKLSAEYEDNANSLEFAQRKTELLSQTLEEQKKKVSLASSALEKANQRYQQAGKKLEDYTSILEDASSTLEEMKSSSNSTTEEIQQQEKAVADAQKQVEKAAKEYRVASDSVSRFRTDLANAETEVIKTSRALDESQKSAQSLAEQFDRSAESFDAMKQRTAELSDTLDTQNGQVTKIAKELTEANDDYEKAGKTLGEYRKNLSEAAARMAELKNNASATTTEIQALERELSNLNNSTAKAEQEYQAASEKVKGLETALSSAKTAADKTEKELREAQQATKQLGDSMKDSKGSASEMATALEKSKEAASAFTESMNKNRTEADYLKSAMEKVAAQYKDNADSAEAMAAKTRALEDIFQNQTQRAELLRAEIERLSMTSGESSEEILKLKTALNRTEAEMFDTSSALSSVQNSLTDFGAVTESSENKSLSFGNVLKEVFRGMGVDADSAIDSVCSALSDYDNKLDGSDSHTGAVAGAMAGVLTGSLIPAIGEIIGKIGELAGKIIESSLEMEKAGARMQVALGLTEDEAERAKGSIDTLNATGIFEDGDAEQAITLVMRLFNETGTSADDLSLRMKALSSGTGADLESIAYTASTMTRAFKDTGLTATQALDLIAGGLQTGKFEAGDFLDALEEYAPAYERMGYSVQEMIDSLVSGVEAGAMSADKVGDSVKEFYNKAADGSADFKEALKTLGFNADSVIKRILDGGPLAQQTYQRITEKVANLSDQTKAAQLASVLFGTQWEDMSTKAVNAAAKVETSIGNVSGATDKAVDVMTSTTTAKVDGFWSKMGTQFRESIANFGDMITFDFDSMNERAERLQGMWSNRLVKNGTENGGNMVSGLADGINSGGDKIAEAYGNIQGAVESSNQSLTDGSAQTGTQLVTNLADGIEQASDYPVDKVNQIGDDMKIAAVGIGAGFGPVGVGIPQSLGNGVTSNIDKATGAVDSMGNAISQSIDSTNTDLSDKGAELPNSYGSGVSGGVQQAVSAVDSMNASVKQSIEKGGNEAAAQQFSAAQKQYEVAIAGYEQIKAAYSRGESGVTEEMVRQAQKRLQTAESNFRQLGGQIPSAMGQGIQSNKGGFLNTIGGLIDSAMQKWKNFLNSLKSGSASSKGYASGTLNADSGMHTVGENGAELIKDPHGNTFLAGQNGPQYFPFKGGERVYSAPQTKAILNSSAIAAQRYAEDLRNKLGLTEAYSSFLNNPGGVYGNIKNTFHSTPEQSQSSVLTTKSGDTWNVTEGAIQVNIPLDTLEDISKLVRISKNELLSYRKGFTGE